MARSTKHPRKRLSTPDNDGAESHRALWTGTIGFGLVQIPVSLVTAEKSNELAFHQLDERDLSPIGYDRINKKTGKKVEWEHIVKGYEISKGEFVVVDDEDFKKANVQSTQTIDIQDFVDKEEIHPTYYERPYYLTPGKQGQKAYVVLRDALAAKNLAAIATVVIRTRQHLCAVLAEGDYLLVELLRFAHELRPIDSLPKPKGDRASAKEIQLASHLIDGMVSRWDPKKYKDTYADDLLKAIHEKAKTGKITAHHDEERPAGNKTIDLVALLQKSIDDKHKKPHASKTKAHRAKSKAA